MHAHEDVGWTRPNDGDGHSHQLFYSQKKDFHSSLQPSSMRETFPSHGFVVAASTVSAAVAIGIAVVVSELLRREFAKLQHEDTQKSAAHALHHVDVSSIAGFSRGLERRSTEESLESVARARHVSKDSLVPGFRGEDSTFRSVNPELMARGRSSKPRLVGENWAPYQTRVVRIALTGGPCAGKSSALEHLIEHATAEGFDVLTAPEVATLYMNTGYSFPSASSETFLEEKCAAKRHLLMPTARWPAEGLLTASGWPAAQVHLPEEHPQAPAAARALLQRPCRQHRPPNDRGLRPRPARLPRVHVGGRVGAWPAGAQYGAPRRAGRPDH